MYIAKPESCDRHVFVGNDVIVGEFRCPVSQPDFATAGRINYHVVAFLRGAVWIEREHTPRFVADPTLATVYNPNQAYLRAPITPNGDHATWIGVSESLAREVVLAFSPADADAHEPFRFASAPVSPRLYLQHLTLVRQMAEPGADRMAVEAGVLELVTGVLSSGYGAAPARTRVSRRAHNLVETTKEAIVATRFENLAVSDIARRVGVSTFHLCRTFRAATGTTMHSFRNAIRVREAAIRAPSHRGNLSSLAMQLGFYSHSHFTAAYRRAFGAPPTRARIAREQ